MAKPSSLALRHWSKILRHWPVDRVRPENVSFQKIMKHRLEKHVSGVSSNAAALSIKANDALVSAVPPQRWDENKEIQQSNALYSLLEDRYAKAYPLPESLRKPASSPNYYENLIQELQDAPSRSWFGGIVKRIKGSLRFT